MRHEINKYYHDNFGTFTQLSAGEIEEILTGELILLDLPAILFLKGGWMIISDEETVPQYVLHAKLQSLLAAAVN